MQKIISLLFFCVVVGCGSSNPPNPYLVFEGEYIIDCHWEHEWLADDPDGSCDFCIPHEASSDFGDIVTVTIIEDNIAVMVGSELNYQIEIELNGDFKSDYNCFDGFPSNSGKLVPAGQMNYVESCNNINTHDVSKLTCIPG